MEINNPYRRFMHIHTKEKYQLMLCFKDMTFCSSDCVNTTCRRHFGEDDKREAEKWWGTPDAPVAFSDFREGCANYRKPDDEKRDLLREGQEAEGQDRDRPSSTGQAAPDTNTDG